MAFAAVIEAREDAKSRLGKLREAMRLRREREKRAAGQEAPVAADAPATQEKGKVVRAAAKKVTGAR